MPTGSVKEKVVCYVVRDGRLLVFEHLDMPWQQTGLQVPAGSIRAGESPEDAALREAAEETGLRSLRQVAKVGESWYDMSPYRSEVHHRHVFHLATEGSPPERWVTYERDPDDGSGLIRFECYWIPISQGHSLAAGQGALLGNL